MDGEFDQNIIYICKKFSNNKMGEEKEGHEVVKEMCSEGLKGSWKGELG